MIECDCCHHNYLSQFIKIWKGYALCPECLKMQSGTTGDLFGASSNVKIS